MGVNMSLGYVFVALLLLATLGVMIAGVVLMGVGGPKNDKYGNGLMMWRVMLQGASLLAIAFLATSH
jgi:hypothetical protein